VNRPVYLSLTRILAIIVPAIIVLAIIALAIPTAGEVRAAPPKANPVTAIQTAIVEQPRSFGYMIGDVFSQRVLLELNGKRFEPATIPNTERIGVWLERRASRIETMPDGRAWLAIDYQVINSPQELRLVRIPAWEVPAPHHARWYAGTASRRARQPTPATSCVRRCCRPTAPSTMNPRSGRGSGTSSSASPWHRSGRA
jgi:hypothetical protein